MFKKTGDNMPILSCYDSDGEKKECPNCGRQLIVIAIEEEDNKLLCEYCDTQETE